MFGAIAVLVVAFLIVAVSIWMLTEYELGGLPLMAVGFIFAFAAVLLFQEEYTKREDERLLKVLVSEKKVELKLNETTRNFDYVLIDSTYKKIFTELDNPKH